MTAYTDYLNSEGWRAKRDMVLQMWGYRCALCYQDGEMHLHHRTYRRLGHEELFDFIPLCDQHHKMFHELEAQLPANIWLKLPLEPEIERALQGIER